MSTSAPSSTQLINLSGSLLTHPLVLLLIGADELAPSMLKRFKESVHEVAHGLECGLALENFAEYDEGDEIECLKVEWKTRPLSLADDPNGNRMSTSASM